MHIFLHIKIAIYAIVFPNLLNYSDVRMATCV